MQLVRHPVHRALTRPQMFAGVTYNFFVINAAVTTELFLITGSFFALPTALADPRHRLFRLPARAAHLRPVAHQGVEMLAGEELQALGLQQLHRLKRMRQTAREHFAPDAAWTLRQGASE